MKTAKQLAPGRKGAKRQRPLTPSPCSSHYPEPMCSRFHFIPTYSKWVKLTQISMSNNLGAPEILSGGLQDLIYTEFFRSYMTSDTKTD